MSRTFARPTVGSSAIATCLALVLATSPVLAQEAGVPSAATDANACLSVIEGQGGMTPNIWQNDCDDTVTVKWFDDAFCESGCIRTLEDFRTSFTERHGAFAFAACRGTDGPIGFDAIDDAEFTCPAIE